MTELPRHPDGGHALPVRHRTSWRTVTWVAAAAVVVAAVAVLHLTGVLGAGAHS